MAESHVEVPAEAYGEYLEPLLLDIAAWAEVWDVKIPQIVVDILSTPVEERYAFAFWIGRTEYELQQWKGEHKQMIFAQRSPQP